MKKDIIDIKFNFDKLLIMEIGRDCEFQEFNNEIHEKLDKSVIEKLSMKFVGHDFSIKKGFICYKEYNNLIFSIYGNNDKIQISQLELLENKTSETYIDVNFDHDFCISTMTHDLSGNTNDIKIYKSDKVKNKYYNMDKKTALLNATVVLDNLNKFKNFINIEKVCRNLNILLSDNYYPIISNDNISLSVSDKYTANNINNVSFASFDIVLNETREKIGNIIFRYDKHSIRENTFGNVFYGIDENYKNKGYASASLRLLIELLKRNNYEGNKDLYFRVEDDNKFSRRVILNTGGQVVKQKSLNDNSHILKITV